MAMVGRRLLSAGTWTTRFRDVAVVPDGAVWMIENAKDGGLFRVTPK